MSNKAVFLDRDGVINEIVYHKEMGIVDSPFTTDQFKLLADVAKAINNFHSQGFLVIIISNQPGIAKDHHDLDEFEKISKKMHDELLKDNAEIDAEYYCFHHPEAKIAEYRKNCDCRKPKPGMIKSAVKDYEIDLAKSFMIGDGINDILAGKNAGCRTIFIGIKKCDICKIMEEEKAHPDFVAPNLLKASFITKKERM